MTSNFVPASLQRIRRFLADKGRFRVKPWADVETTLEAFRSTLYRNRSNEPFWDELKSLLSQLCADIQKRIDASESGLIENEVLGSERRDQLLDEIRRAIAAGPEVEGGFRALSSQLSAQAFALLLILGSTTTVACYDSRRNDEDAAIVPDSGPEDDNSATQTATGGTDSANARTSGGVQTNGGSGGMQPSYGGGIAGMRPSYAGASGFSTGTDDAGIPIDAGPVVPPLFAPPSPGTLEEMAEECMPEATELRQAALNCIDALHESWRIGLTEYFRNNGCNKVRTALEILLGVYYCGGPPSPCLDPDNAAEFDVDAVIDHCYCCIYVGVRFE